MHGHSLQRHRDRQAQLRPSAVALATTSKNCCRRHAGTPSPSARNSCNNMAHHIARQMLGSDADRARRGPPLGEQPRPSFSAPTAAAGLPPRAGVSSWFTNPPVVFPETTSTRSNQGSWVSFLTLKKHEHLCVSETHGKPYVSET